MLEVRRAVDKTGKMSIICQRWDRNWVAGSLITFVREGMQSIIAEQCPGAQGQTTTTGLMAGGSFEEAHQRTGGGGAATSSTAALPKAVSLKLS